MSVIVTENIPLEKLNQFHAILKATGGRYLHDPVYIGHEKVSVHYEAGDYEEHCTAWRRCITPIVEVRKDQWWRVLLRRCRLR